MDFIINPDVERQQLEPFLMRTAFASVNPECVLRLLRVIREKKRRAEFMTDKHSGNYKLARRYYLAEGLQGFYFTHRELQMAVMLEDHSYLEIAEHYDLSRRTVEFYVNNMRRKTLCNSKRELIQFLKERNLFNKIKKLIEDA